MKVPLRWSGENLIPNAATKILLLRSKFTYLTITKIGPLERYYGSMEISSIKKPLHRSGITVAGKFHPSKSRSIGAVFR
jgi:hypothetical protein